MEAQYMAKGSISELIESGATNDGEKELAVANNRSKTRGLSLFLRVAAVVFGLAAVVVLGVNKQTTTVVVTLVPTLPAVSVPVTAKWHYQSASVYFMWANAIACTYGAISLLIILANKGAKKRIVTMMIVFFDLVMVVLLFSSLGASLAIGLISYEGSSHTQWHKVCNVIGNFCRQSSVAVGLSGVASSAFLMLVFGAVLMNLHETN